MSAISEFEQFVAVQFEGHQREYTYIAPVNTEVGDYAVVPTPRGWPFAVVRVVKIGLAKPAFPCKRVVQSLGKG